MKKKLSIVDIAKHLNVSTTTVSFILNGRAKEKRISDEMVEKVLSFVEKVGYKPNVLARSLRTGKSNIIGLMIENIANPFFANIARMIEENAYNKGYKIIYSSTSNDTEKAKELINIFKERHVDGYIIAPPDGIEGELTALAQSGVPVVLFDRYLRGIENVDYVGINGRDSISNAIHHLASNGYKNIGFVTLDSQQTQMQERLQGYEKAVKELGLPAEVKEISYNHSEEAIVKHITAFVKRKPELDALVFATNYLGISGLKTIKKLGLKITDDIAVLVFDDHDLFELHSPSITAIAQPIQEISEKVISILLNKLDTPPEKRASETIILPTHLLIRDSSARNK